MSKQSPNTLSSLVHDNATIQSVSKSRYAILSDEGQLLEGIASKGFVPLTCGDRVEISNLSSNQAKIHALAERRNTLYRQDLHRTKLIAANFDQVVIIIANEPPFNLELLYRILIAAEVAPSKTLIVLNKTDLPHDNAIEKLTSLEHAGYTILKICALNNIEILQQHIHNHHSVLIGESGMGKSTILNVLVPGADSKTAEISKALNSGQHTTTRTQRYLLPLGGSVTDCPGIQTFGIQFVSQAALLTHFQEFHPWSEQCQFYNCQHTGEQGCAVFKRHQAGHITSYRWQLYQKLLAEINASKPYPKRKR